MIVGYSAALVADALSAVPGQWRNRVSGIYADKRAHSEKNRNTGPERFDQEHAADQWLGDLAARMRALRVPLNLTDDELCRMAESCAVAAVDLASRPGQYFTSAADLRASMAKYAAGFGITPPGQEIDDSGALRRMADGQWWRRQLRVAQGRAIEREAITIGYVHKRAEIYASTITVDRRRQQKARNAAALETTSATNQQGDVFTLAQLAAKAVSNPVIRRGELMTRISGFESVALGLGHVGMFFTVTCPSRMHAKKTIGKKFVTDNPKFDGTMPREAQKYLTGVWAKTRAALARTGVSVYGFRIAEPHHDGAPHWHLLLFVAPDRKNDLCRIFSGYVCKADAEELNTPAARGARFNCRKIDPDQGSAAGYVAKYIAKNIDGGGYQVQGDLHGDQCAAVTPSHRVEAWASVWGIRQFQQIGGPPVGIWRELRRLPESDDLTDTLIAARIAVSKTDDKKADWAAYCALMGGAILQRKNLPIRIVKKTAEIDAETGETAAPTMTRYGEIAPAGVFGVVDVAVNKTFKTRLYTWVVERVRALVVALDSPRTRLNNCTPDRREGWAIAPDGKEKVFSSAGFWEKFDATGGGFPVLFNKEMKNASLGYCTS